MARVFVRAIVLCFLSLSIPSSVSADGEKILVFKDSLPYMGHTAAIRTAMGKLRTFASAHNFTFDTTIHLSSFNTANLAKYDAVLFMYPEWSTSPTSSTGYSDTMSADQDSALKTWLLAGHAYFGMHCDTRLNANWSWWKNNFFGQTYVQDIGPVNSTFHVVNPNEFMTQGIPATFTGNEQLRVDSVFFAESDTNYKILIKGDVNDYVTNNTAANPSLKPWVNNTTVVPWMPFFPFVYRHNYQGARMFHMAPGHNSATWTAAPDSGYWSKLFLNGLLYTLNRPGYGGTTAIAGSAPKVLTLQPVYNATGQSLSYGLPKKARVVIRIFNMEGRMVSRLVDRTFGAGYYSVSLPAGLQGSVYLVDFKAGNIHRTMKITR